MNLVCICPCSNAVQASPFPNKNCHGQQRACITRFTSVSSSSSHTWQMPGGLQEEAGETQATSKCIQGVREQQPQQPSCKRTRRRNRPAHSPLRALLRLHALRQVLHARLAGQPLPLLPRGLHSRGRVQTQRLNGARRKRSGTHSKVLATVGPAVLFEQGLHAAKH